MSVFHLHPVDKPRSAPRPQRFDVKNGVEMQCDRTLQLFLQQCLESPAEASIQRNLLCSILARLYCVSDS